jgi:pyruvate dehydrogenase E1 component
VIIQDGLRRMYVDNENIFYYITVMNENYRHPDMPQGVEEGILKGMYRLHKNTKKGKAHLQLLGSGTILREVIAAAELLQKDYKVTVDIWSVTSFNELRREGLAVERYNRMHPEENPRQSYVTQQLKDCRGPVVAATDYMRLYADQIRPFVPSLYKVLGTDGYGRSDTRSQLRHFFEVDAKFITLAALEALVEQGDLPKSVITDALNRYDIDADKLDPATH